MGMCLSLSWGPGDKALLYLKESHLLGYLGFPRVTKLLPPRKTLSGGGARVSAQGEEPEERKNTEFERQPELVQPG